MHFYVTEVLAEEHQKDLRRDAAPSRSSSTSTVRRTWVSAVRGVVGSIRRRGATIGLRPPEPE
jgi:hypothetical protein